jgi:hypothetical protein
MTWFQVLLRLSILLPESLSIFQNSGILLVRKFPRIALVFTSSLQPNDLEIDLTAAIDVLLKNAFRSDLSGGYNILIDHSLLAVMTLLHATVNEEVKQKYVVIIVEQFTQTAYISGERKSLIQTGLLSCLQV